VCLARRVLKQTVKVHFRPDLVAAVSIFRVAPPLACNKSAFDAPGQKRFAVRCAASVLSCVTCVILAINCFVGHSMLCWAQQIVVLVQALQFDPAESLRGARCIVFPIFECTLLLTTLVSIFSLSYRHGVGEEGEHSPRDLRNPPEKLR